MEHISRRVFGSFLGSALTVATASKVFAVAKPKHPVKKKKIVKPVAKPTQTSTPTPQDSTPSSQGATPVQLNSHPLALKDLPVGNSLAATYTDPKNQGVQNILLHRTNETTVVAFSAICTHKGCTIDGVSPASFDCPCHGSSYDSKTGSVLNGPAVRALTALTVEIHEGVVDIVTR
jgi:Rieske Fe-S protein